MSCERERERGSGVVAEAGSCDSRGSCAKRAEAWGEHSGRRAEEGEGQGEGQGGCKTAGPGRRKNAERFCNEEESRRNLREGRTGRGSTDSRRIRRIESPRHRCQSIIWSPLCIDGTELQESAGAM